MTRSPNCPNRRHGRRGAILLIVLTLLALFAVIGLSFVFYAESQANQSRVYRDSVNTPAGAGATVGSGDTAVPDPGVAVNALLGQMLVPSQANQDSALYGHELWRLMYGGQGGTIPYNGFGIVHHPVNTPLGSFDRADAIRFTRWVNPYGNATLNTQIDPETLYTNANPSGFNVKGGAGLVAPTGAVFVPKNAGYTYPDRNNALLTALDPLHGQTAVNKFSVIAPSGHRPRLFDPNAAYGDFGLEPTNPEWYSAGGYFKTLRPRPIDNLTPSEAATALPQVRTILGLPAGAPIPYALTPTPAQAAQLAALYTAGKLGQFPMPPRNTDGTITGDVQNLRHTNGQQHNDSVWVPIGATPVKFRDTYVVPMVAMNLRALDGQVNTSVAGNAVNYATTPATPHSSNQGFGPSEINLAGLMPDPATPGPLASGGKDAAVVAAIRGRQAQRPAQYNDSGSVIPSYFWPATPVPPSLPDEANPTAINALVSANKYPNYPVANPATGVVKVYSVTPFQPSINSALQLAGAPGSYAIDVSQAQPRPESAITFDGGAGQLTYPGLTVGAANRFATVPSSTSVNSAFVKAPDANTPPKGDTVNNPLAYNPYLLRQATPENKGNAAANEPLIYPTSDSKRLVARWSDKATYISDTALVASVPLAPYPSSVAAQFPTSVANQHRAGLTPVSNSLHAAGLSAMNFGLKDTAGTRRILTYTPGGYPFPTLTNPATADLAKIAGAFPTATAPTFAGGQPDGDASDVTATYTSTSPPTGFAFDAPKSLANVRAALAAVDVNQALPDYRTRLNQSLDAAGNVTPTSAATALAARQSMATEVFKRLCVSTGASVRFDANNTIYVPQPAAIAEPKYSITGVPGVAGAVPVTQSEYDALRWLAQVAANIVDQIDTDDISTAFVWNPNAAVAPNPYDQTTNELNGDFALPNRVVYGVEKPRLVLNEVYAELSNTAADNGLPKATSGKYEARFYLELLHAGTSAPSGSTPVVGDNVQVAPYRVQITNDAATPGNATTPGSLANVSNVLGSPASKPIIDFALNNTDTGSTGDPANNRVFVQPNNGQFKVIDLGAMSLNGFYVVGPEAKTGTYDAPAFMQNTASAPYNAMLKANPASPGADTVTSTPATVTTSSDSLSYQYQAGPKSGIDSGADKNYVDTVAHTVLLRRLPNPYLSVNTTDNQYVTVDTMTNVKVLDAVAKGTDSARTPLPAQAKPENHYSLARVQPYTGQVGDPSLGLASSLTLRQTNNPASTTSQALSFFQHNAQTTTAPTALTGDANLVTPFEWMPHFDRRLINAEELLNVPTGRPHDLTLQFAQPNGPRPLFHQYTLRTAFEQRVSTVAPFAAPAAPATFAPYYRALELLTVKPWVSDIPHGGRVPGKLNVNAVQDKLVFDAWLDQNANNKFTFNEKEELWKQLMLSRSNYDITNPPPVAPNLYPRVLGNSYDEVGPPATGGVTPHRPFKSFGIGQFPGGAEMVQYPTGVEDTLLRHLPSGTTVTPTPLAATGGTTSQQPLFSRYGDTTRTTTLTTTDPLVPYTESEPLRKLLNNLTTTSDTFQLVFTVGYFEAREYDPAQPNNPVILGKEMFLKVPGDMRSQFTAVLDRSMMTTTQTSEVLKVLESREPVALPVLVSAGGDGLSYSNADPTGPLPHRSDRGLVLALKGNVPDTSMGSPVSSTLRAEELVLAGTMQVTGVYEGKTYTVSPGSILNIGTGANRLQVRAYFDSANPNPYNSSRWTYNPLTGTARISYQVVEPQPNPAALKDYPAGSMVTNYQFGPQTVAPPDATTNPAVLYFGRLTP